MYKNVSTAFDTMKEFLIYGVELDGNYGIPMLPAVSATPYDTVDFSESFSKKIKNHRKLNVNFYVDDTKFERIWSSPDKYLDHLKCFHSVIAPDFSIDTQMPLAMQLWNKYRNHALAHYMTLHGIKVIPNVNILPPSSWDWCFDGFPKHSTVACCTNGRVRAKAARLEFCEDFYEMVRKLEPTRVIIVGRMPEELRTDVEIINLKTRNMKINEGSALYGNFNG